MIFRNPKKSLDKFFSGIDFNEIEWITFAVNHIAQDCATITAQWELRGRGSLHILKISNDSTNADIFKIDAWSNQKKLYIGQVQKSEIAQPLAFFLDQSMQKIRQNLIKSTEVPSTQSINPTNEPHGLEWLRTSLVVLKGALETEFSTPAESDSINHLEVLLFSGIKPNSDSQTFRLRIFNLDFEIIEDKSNTLRVSVLNKGKNDSFAGIEPVFTGFFTKSKQPVANEFIQLLPPMAKAFNNFFFF